MYHRKDNCTGELQDEFIAGVEQFDTFALSQNKYIVNGVYRCPCSKCKNAKYLTLDDVKLHLYKKGFVGGHWTWTSHGEVYDIHRGEGTSSDGWNGTGAVHSDQGEP